jgi:FlaA1/EpsC-like NDP-sugar epimerase
LKVLITGAGGNLGGLLAKQLCSNQQLELYLMIHNKDVCEELKYKTFKEGLKTF